MKSVQPKIHATLRHVLSVHHLPEIIKKKNVNIFFFREKKSGENINLSSLIYPVAFAFTIYMIPPAKANKNSTCKYNTNV